MMKTYLLRAVSRMNRQGTNITRDGSLLVNEMNDSTLSKVHINPQTMMHLSKCIFLVYIMIVMLCYYKQKQEIQTF